MILLTALSSGTDRIEGLESGADDFVIKPFNGDELKVRVKNLIAQRKKLSRLLESRIRKNENNKLLDFKDSGITSMDEQFLQRMIETLAIHYTNPEFKVKMFCHEVGMSRITLHRKITALTGKSTGDFIRTYRLNRAAQLIRKKSASIAEITYDVGFNSPSYFTKCFSEQFGKTPSQFAEED